MSTPSITCARSLALWAVLTLGACNIAPPSAVLYVSDPTATAGDAVSLRIGREGQEPEVVALDGKTFPLSVTVTRATPGDYTVRVEALDDEERVLAGAVVMVAFASGEVSTVDVALARACDPGSADADQQCDDGLFCSGVETCGADGFCVVGEDPCATPHRCVIARCDETLDLCDLGVDHGACEGEVEGADVVICDVSVGCIAGTRCTLDTECDDGVACNGVETCALGACTPGAPPLLDDENPCTVDVCTEESGVVNVPLPNGSVCTLEGGAKGVCLDLACSISACGDGVVDVEQDEECDDGNASDLDLCRSNCTRVERAVIDFLGGGYCGAQGIAGAAFLGTEHLASTADGGLLLADGYDSIIRRWDPATDTVTVIAGTRMEGSAIEGAPATEVPLYLVSALAEEPSTGRVFFGTYVRDRGYAVMAVDDEGRVRTVAGLGDEDPYEYQGDDPRLAYLYPVNGLAFDPTDGALWVLVGYPDAGALLRVDVSDLDDPVVSVVAGFPTDDIVGPRSFELSDARDVLVLDDGSVLVSFGDKGPSLFADGVAELDLGGTGDGFVRVAGVAGPSCPVGIVDDANVGSVELCGPSRLTRGRAGERYCVLVGDEVACVRDDDTIDLLAGGGGSSDYPVPSDGEVLSPMGTPVALALAGDGLYVVARPSWTSFLTRLTPGVGVSVGAAVEVLFDGDTQSTELCGVGGDPADATLFDPRGIAVVGGRLTVGAAHRVYDIDDAGKIVEREGFDYAYRVAGAPDGTAFTMKATTLRRYLSGQTDYEEISSGGAVTDGEGILASDAALHGAHIAAVDGTRVLLAEESHHRIRDVHLDGDGVWRVTTLAGTGAPSADWSDGPASSTAVLAPFVVAVTPDGAALFAERWSGRVRRVADGEVKTVYTSPRGVAAFALDADGNGWVIDDDGWLWLLPTKGPSGPGTGVPAVAVGGTGAPLLGHGPLESVAILPPDALDVDASGSLYLTYGHAARILRAKVVPPP